MAIELSEGTPDDLLYKFSSLGTSLPLTLSLWAYIDTSLPDTKRLSVYIMDDLTSLQNQRRVASISYGNTPSWGGSIVDYSGIDFDFASISNGTSKTGWVHFLFEWIASNDRRITVDGVEDQDTGNRSPSLGADTNFPFGSFPITDGELPIAEIGIWEAELTDNQKTGLIQGFSPIVVRAHDIHAYIPCANEMVDLIDPSSWTTQGSPSKVNNHPPVKGMVAG